MRATLDDYFSRLRAARGGRLEGSYEADYPSPAYRGEPDAASRVAWEPTAMTDQHALELLQAAWPSRLHDDLSAYWSSLWFLELMGGYGGFGVVLEPTVSPEWVEDFVYKQRGYLGAHGGAATWMPMGLVSPSDLLLVVNNTNGTVAVEDHERGTFTELAPNLEALISGLGLKSVS